MSSAYFADAGPLWAITSFYNPNGYWRRRHNYRLFRHHLQVPLLTVELAFAGGYELADADAEILIRCSGGDVLWQKERLLNIALDRLPPSCRQVVWVDCDVLFQRPDWAQALSRQLELTPLVQPYSRAVHLRRDAPLGRWPADDDILYIRESVAGLVGRGLSAADYLGQFGGQRRHKRAPGHVWAARRELLQRHGLYDACITGGGDTAIASAAYGCPQEVVNFQAHERSAREPLPDLGRIVPSIGPRRGRLVGGRSVASLAWRVRQSWHSAAVLRSGVVRFRPRG